jgi:poly-gamma-glutamate synthesis protein (capsule biosynthesis protein)
MERSSRPTPAQRKAAETAEAAGAVLLVGHHPHVLQPVEPVGELVAVCGLGNFAFPAPAGRAAQARSVIAFAELGAAVRSVALLPVAIAQGRPRVATDDRAAVEAAQTMLPRRAARAG